MSATQMLLDSNNEAKAKDFQGNGRGKRHYDAMTNPKSEFEAAIVLMIRGFAEYADAHKVRYDSPIGEDFVLGRPWKQIGKSIIDLLNGETGRIDCGTIDGLIRKIAKEQNATEAPSWWRPAYRSTYRMTTYPCCGQAPCHEAGGCDYFIEHGKHLAPNTESLSAGDAEEYDAEGQGCQRITADLTTGEEINAD